MIFSIKKILKELTKHVLKRLVFNYVCVCVSTSMWSVHIYTLMCIYRRQKRVSSILLFSLHIPLRKGLSLKQRLMFSCLGWQPAWEILLSWSPSGLQACLGHPASYSRTHGCGIRPLHHWTVSPATATGFQLVKPKDSWRWGIIFWNKKIEWKDV